MNDLRDLYEDIILDHNRNPRNYPKHQADANHSSHGFNPLCGDEFFVHLTIKDDVITDIGFDGAGCAISTASASIMTEALMGKSVSQATTLFNQVHDLLTNENATPVTDEELGKLVVLKGVKEFPMRVKCATLAWHTLNAAMNATSKTVTTE